MMHDYGLALFLQAKFLPPSDVSSNVQMLLRWIHLLAGITWIGLLYFFNLVNVPFMKEIDAPTKGKVVPTLLPRALWWFRWGAVVTVLAGFLFWMIIQSGEPPKAPGSRMGITTGIWLGLVLLVWIINYLLLRKESAVTKSGWPLAVILALLALSMAALFVAWCSYEGASNRMLSIGVGGGFGLFMLLNVWGIIWPAQKRIIAWTKENAEKGTAIPPEAATLARRAFLASRTNFWLSIPMLFFMAAASHYPMFVGG